MFIVLEVLGAALLLAEAWACSYVVRSFIRRRRPISWVAAVIAIGAGILLAVLASRPFTYSISKDLRAAGLPFPVVLFQYERGSWVDYVGHRGLWIADIALAAALPQLLLAVAIRRRLREPVGA